MVLKNTEDCYCFIENKLIEWLVVRLSKIRKEKDDKYSKVIKYRYFPLACMKLKDSYATVFNNIILFVVALIAFASFFIYTFFHLFAASPWLMSVVGIVFTVYMFNFLYTRVHIILWYLTVRRVHNIKNRVIEKVINENVDKTFSFAMFKDCDKTIVENILTDKLVKIVNGFRIYKI